jgi:hypothetical protein
MTENSEVLKDSSDTEKAEDDVRNHLSDVEAGAGCTEIWEHLSENRDDAAQD